MADADPASTLAAIREHQAPRLLRESAAFDDYALCIAEIDSLLAAVEAAGELAGKWETEAARLDALAELKADPAVRAQVSVRAQAFQECARELRAAALGGKEAGDALPSRLAPLLA